MPGKSGRGGKGREIVEKNGGRGEKENGLGCKVQKKGQEPSEPRTFSNLSGDEKRVQGVRENNVGEGGETRGLNLCLGAGYEVKNYGHRRCKKNLAAVEEERGDTRG